MFKSILSAALIATLSAGASTASGQATQPAYEVVSVAPVAPGTSGRPQAKMTPDGWLERNNTLAWLLGYAFGITDFDRIKNAPAWANTERFNIDARFAPEAVDSAKGLTVQQQGKLLQPVLVDRFHLKYHLEKRDFPVYFLEVEQGGPKLVAAKPDENGQYKSSMHTKNLSEFVGQGLTTELMTVNLTYFAGRQVVDRTGLTGHYDFDLSWTPDAPGDSGAAQAPGGPPFFAAVQSQLGLKLVASVAPFDVLIVDSVEHPTPN